ncbi:MAG: hypothetical protein K0S39_2008 [Paenibacillus sp.]|jgi:sugar phosphate isomerase/epimerase|nr:hypothetical protein [Paenibacillus sp.]
MPASTYEGDIYFGSILLERNRWSPGKQPSYLVSDWMPKLKNDGFDGIELWENHAILSSNEELDRLSSPLLPVSVFNSYISFEDGEEEQRRREQAARYIRQLGAKAVKFNFGREPERLEVYIRNWKQWEQLLPADCRILCECHPNTVLEEPQAAAAAFKLMGADRCEAIVHPFHSLGPLGDWFTHLGSFITHAHVQYRNSANAFLRLSSNPAEVEEHLAAMKKAGFKGSFTLEFAQGTGPDETQNALYEAAFDDLSLLRQWQQNK